MKYVIFLIILAVLKESHPLNPEILKYDQYMKDFEATGRQIKQEAKDKEIDGLVVKREDRRYWKKNYEQDEEKLEKWYLDLHPDVNNITWPQIKNLTQKIHRKICEKVLYDIHPFFHEFIWVEEDEPDPEALSTKVKEPVILELKKDMLSIPVVECLWDRNASVMTSLVPPQTFLWLTHANRSRVFTLSKEEHSDIFHLQTGLHPVSYGNK